jgi:hypothetical protein
MIRRLSSRSCRCYKVCMHCKCSCMAHASTSRCIAHEFIYKQAIVSDPGSKENGSLTSVEVFHM